MDYKMLEEIQNLQNIKVCGNQERDMVKDYWDGMMEVFLKEFGMLIKEFLEWWLWLISL
jgi:hypothetical protein